MYAINPSIMRASEGKPAMKVSTGMCSYGVGGVTPLACIGNVLTATNTMLKTIFVIKFFMTVLVNLFWVYYTIGCYFCQYSWSETYAKPFSLKVNAGFFV